MRYFNISGNTLVKLGAMTVMTAILAACSEGPKEEFVPVTLTGQVSMQAGPTPTGTVHFRLYNLWWLEGDLRHPLEEIADFTSDSTNFSHSFEYPAHKGTGLAVHAWIDTDGDGVFCTPTAKLDPSGLTAMEESPAGDVTMNIVLTDNCQAANFFYPPRRISRTSDYCWHLPVYTAKCAGANSQSANPLNTPPQLNTDYYRAASLLWTEAVTFSKQHITTRKLQTQTSHQRGCSHSGRKLYGSASTSRLYSTPALSSNFCIWPSFQPSNTSVQPPTNSPPIKICGIVSKEVCACRTSRIARPR